MTNLWSSPAWKNGVRVRCIAAFKRKCSRRVQRHNPFEPGHGSRQHIQRLTRCTGPWTGSASGARKSLDHVKRLPSALIEHDTSLASRPVRIKEQQDQICTFRLRQCSILDAELFGDRDDKTRAQVEAELPAFRKPAHDFQEVVACPLARAKELRQGSRAAHLLKHAQPAIRRQGIEAKKSVFLECASPTSQLTPRKSQTGAGGTTLNQKRPLAARRRLDHRPCSRTSQACRSSEARRVICPCSLLSSRHSGSIHDLQPIRHDAVLG